MCNPMKRYRHFGLGRGVQGGGGTTLLRWCTAVLILPSPAHRGLNSQALISGRITNSSAKDVHRPMSLRGQFPTARAQCRLLHCLSREHFCTPPPYRGMHDLFKAASGVQTSGPWDPWLPGVENSRLLAQRTVRPLSDGVLSSSDRPGVWVRVTLP